jgi:hypothetical protein
MGRATSTATGTGTEVKQPNEARCLKPKIIQVKLRNRIGSSRA